MHRNANTYFSNVPTPTLPRTRHDKGIVMDLATMKHGRLQVLNCKFMYPGSTKSRASSLLVQADTFEKFPLDSVEMDVYEFFVPLRIIDKDFEKVLGDVDAYDTNVYTFPDLELDFSASHLLTHDTILNGLGWRCPTQALFDYDSTNHGWKPKSTTTTFDKVNPYPIMAYYLVYNEFFRDNNVDPTIPIEDLKNNKLSLLSNLFNNLEALPVNKFHDRFTSGLLTPQKPVAGINTVTIPLGLSAPVYAGSTDNQSLPVYAQLKFVSAADGSAYTANRNLGLSSSGKLVGAAAGTGFTTDTYPTPINLKADLSKATGASIDQLRLAFAIQELAEIKSSFGSRMSSYYRGVWGINVPDYILDRPEYLGGKRFTLSMLPILNQANTLGEMSGQSRTLTNRYHSQKSFYEFGFWLTVGCFRTYRTYSQGITNEAFKFKDELDLYNRKFANLGNVGQPNYLLYNDFNNPTVNNQIFNYNESWTELRTDISTGSGDFSSNYGDSSELYQKWSFQDIYASQPIFSASWLKEGDAHVKRTMTGRLLPNATSDYGHQYMLAYIHHDFDTIPLPAHPIPSGLTNRI